MLIRENAIFSKESNSFDNARAYLRQLLLCKLQEGFHVIIHLDDYYLPGKPGYQRRHFLHVNMLYGYDAKYDCLSAVGYGDDAKYSQQVYSTDTILDGFISRHLTPIFLNAADLQIYQCQCGQKGSKTKVISTKNALSEKEPQFLQQTNEEIACWLNKAIKNEEN